MKRTLDQALTQPPRIPAQNRKEITQEGLTGLLEEGTGGVRKHTSKELSDTPEAYERSK